LIRKIPTPSWGDYVSEPAPAAGGSGAVSASCVDQAGRRRFVIGAVSAGGPGVGLGDDLRGAVQRLFQRFMSLIQPLL
jgi:hypothetical protein